MADGDTRVKKSKMKWFILLFVLLLIGGGGAGAWFFFLADKWQAFTGTGASTQSVRVEQVPGKENATSAPLSNTVPLPVFTVNLSDPLGRRFIKISLAVEVKDSNVAQELKQQDARVRDSIILLLSSKTYADIAPTESKLILKNEIAGRLNQILGGPKVTQVFITDMVIQ